MIGITMNDEAKTFLFNQVPVSRVAMVAAAMKYRGIRYSRGTTYVVQEENGSYAGSSNCFGILLLVARDVGLLDADFDVNLRPDQYPSKAAVLWGMIHNNFDPVDQESNALRPADILLFRWRDVNHRLAATHHVGMCIETPDDESYGRMLHVLDGASGGMDKVNVHRISQLEWDRLDGIWRLKGIAN